MFLILKDTSGFFQYVVVNLWCWASTIMPEASQKVAETAEITKTAPQTQPQMPDKTRQKVVETAEITKTAPKPSQKAGKDLAKSS